MKGEMTKHRVRYVIIALVTVSLVMFYHIKKQYLSQRLEDIVIYTSEKDIGMRDPSVTCKFPMIHPFHNSITQYVSIAKPIRCTKRIESLTYIDKEGILTFNASALYKEGYKEVGIDITCAYNEITRKPGNDFEIIYGEEIPLTGSVRPVSDFVYVHCNNKAGFQIYNNFHAYAQKNYSIRKFKNDVELGVVTIGLDSLSRLNFMRQLPKTYRYITGTMQGVIMYGFNKVGENTLPNVAPMLTGKFKPRPPYNHFQDWKFMWTDFEKRGAATMYAEDLPEINMFDYNENGIKEQPTHHYMRTYWLAIEKSLLYAMSSSYCLGGVPKHLIFFEYLKSFMRQYRESPVFLFSLFNELTHDYLNAVGAIDDDLVEFFNSSSNEGLFNRSVVLFLGDHGNRMDAIRATEVGKIEDGMPLVSVVVPPWADKAYPAWRRALTQNANRLTSTFDIFKTYARVLSTLDDEYESNSIEEDDEKKRFDGDPTEENGRFDGPGVPFFRPVPVTRTCREAGVPEWFCLCSAKEEPLSTTDERSVKAARVVLRYFNGALLRGLAPCARLSLASVKRAVEKVKEKVITVELLFSTEPGNGMFEAVLKYDPKTASYDVIGEVLRVNPYGSQAKCLSHKTLLNAPILRGVCYCI